MELRHRTTSLSAARNWRSVLVQKTHEALVSTKQHKQDQLLAVHVELGM